MAMVFLPAIIFFSFFFFCGISIELDLFNFLYPLELLLYYLTKNQQFNARTTSGSLQVNERGLDII